MDRASNGFRLPYLAAAAALGLAMAMVALAPVIALGPEVALDPEVALAPVVALKAAPVNDGGARIYQGGTPPTRDRIAYLPLILKDAAVSDLRRPWDEAGEDFEGGPA